MVHLDLTAMSRKYREVRKAVYKEATISANGAAAEHEANQRQFRDRMTAICHRANLRHFRGSDRRIASEIWHWMWTTNRYAGIRADTASKEINDIAEIFDDFERFCAPEWDCVAKGHSLVRAGSDASHFLNGTGLIKGKRTIGNLPKLQKIVNVARQLKHFLDAKVPSAPTLHFVTNGHTETEVWQIHRHLLDIGYTADITAVHFMMEIGFPIVKPDIVLTGLFLDWGWLHAAVHDLPRDVTREDLKGKGKYRCRFKYDDPRVYRPVIDLARRIVQTTKSEDLKDDIGWVTDNPVREFDLFIVKSGQQIEEDWGITRQLFKSDWPSKTGRRRCSDH